MNQVKEYKNGRTFLQKVYEFFQVLPYQKKGNTVCEYSTLRFDVISSQI